MPGKLKSLKSNEGSKPTPDNEAHTENTTILPSKGPDGTPDLDITQSTNPTVPYTVFNHNEKYIVLYLAASCSFWSSMSVPIYYPALQVLESYFGLTEELINLSVVVYMIAQGIAPTIFAGFADKFGRRPVLITCLVGYIGANIGLALSNVYWLILLLRIVQSIAIAPTVALISGVIGDYTERYERGGYIGLGSGLTLIGQGIGSLIGAALIAGFDWRAIFWFLTIGAGVSLVFVSILLPETNRSVVGNQSITPARFWNRAPILLLPKIRKRWHLDEPYFETKIESKKADFLTPFKIMIIPEIAICLFGQGIHFVIWSMNLTTLSTQLSKTYDYTVMKIGLCYLPGGICGLTGAILSGKVLDWNYRRNHRKFELLKEEGIIAPEARFNIVKSRVEVAIPFLVLADAFTLVYGWCIGKHVHVSAVIISSTMISIGCISVVGSMTTLLVDLYPSNSSSATSAVNFTRCTLGALFIGVMALMDNVMTIGGTFTFMAVLGTLSTLSLLIPMKYGMKWIEARDSSPTK